MLASMLPRGASSDPATTRVALALGLGTTVALVAMRQRAIRGAIASMLSVRARARGDGGNLFVSRVGAVARERGGWWWWLGRRARGSRGRAGSGGDARAGGVAERAVVNARWWAWCVWGGVFVCDW